MCPSQRWQRKREADYLRSQPSTGHSGRSVHQPSRAVTRRASKTTSRFGNGWEQPPNRRIRTSGHQTRPASAHEQAIYVLSTGGLVVTEIGDTVQVFLSRALSAHTASIRQARS